MNISEHITHAEAIKSQQAVRLGISNEPTPEHLTNMRLVAQNCFEPLRKHFKRPIGISSFYRSPKVNKAIGGSTTSQHCQGLAIDIDADIFGALTNREIFEWLKANVTFDQLIYEFGNAKSPDWVHVSYNPKSNRGQILIAYKEGKSTKYAVYSEAFLKNIYK